MEHFNEQKEQRLSAEKWKQATLADNFIFCKVMSTNLDLCKELLEMLLHIKIEKIKMAESEKTAQTDFSSKGVRFDVYIKDETNRCFDLEMQTVSRRDLQKRARYYQAIMDIDSLEHGQTYTSLNDNYVIFLCLDDIFKQGLPVYSFENVCKENSKITLNDRTYKVFFNAKEYDKMPDRNLREFFQYLYENKKSDSKFINDIDSKVKFVRTDVNYRRQCMTLEQEILLAREEERDEQMTQTAERMLKMNFEPEKIAIITGLPIEHILKMQDELKTVPAQ